jgi:hypothetical protein
MEAAGSSKTPVNIYQTTQSYIQKNSNLQSSIKFGRAQCLSVRPPACNEFENL